MKKLILMGLIYCISQFCFAGQALTDVPITIKGDKFYRGEKEFRIWGFNIGQGLGATPERYKKVADRWEFLGVTMVRMHHLDTMHWGQDVGLLRCREGKADNTRSLIHTRQFFELWNSLKDKGIYVTFQLYQGRMYQPGDADILQTTPEDKKAWAEAIGKIGINLVVQKTLAPFDERCEALMAEYAGQVFNLKNPRTGVLLKDDPQLAMLAMINEGFSFRMMHAKKAQNQMPEYFQNKLRRRWNEYLLKQYASDEALRKAWGTPDGLEPGESLAKKNVEFKPMHKEKGSARRSEDVLKFLTEMDLAFYKRMVGVLRKIGYAGPVILSDWNRAHAGTDQYWLKEDILPYYEDHGYAPAGTEIFSHSNLSINMMRLNFQPHPYATVKPYWRGEDGYANAGEYGGPHWARLAYPLFHAVYFSLDGIDGVTYHAWDMNPRWSLDWTKLEKDKVRWHHLNADIPWQTVFRAAGRLFKSGEINPLTDVAALRRLNKTANISNDQVYRSGKEQLLTVETPRFVVLADTHPIRRTFKKVDMDITSDQCNIIIAEQTSPKEYEVTAVGLAGDSMPDVDPVTKEKVYQDFEPMTFVTGTIRFKGQTIDSVAHIDDAGNTIRQLPGRGETLEFADGVRLYRIKMK